MHFWAYLLIVLYSIVLVYITFYCLLQFHLLYYYKKYYRVNGLQSYKKADIDSNDLPFVTIQLPIFNEMYVVERLIDRIVETNYPKDKFEIQVLDDSTDETVEISKRKVAEYQAKGFDISFHHRVDRTGYKAGALKAAMPAAKGKFIAIFDADFLPDPDFLLTTIPYFDDKKTGVVQTRWEHINEDYSVITRLQAMQLNVHFTIEQMGRHAGNFMLQFNGTAGVWRRATIDDAGGWEADTLTEDLDLSYRAQLKGWRIKYLEKFGSPAELPAEMNGLKSQQHRWMKGGAENAIKLLPAVWRSNLSLGQKIHATGHLMASGVFLFVFLAGLFSVPLLLSLTLLDINSDYFTFFMIGWVSIIAVYYVANVQAELKKENTGKKIIKFIILFPLFLALSMGLSLHNSIAVLQGYRGKKSAFIRTPKFNIKGIKDTFEKQNYLAKKLPWTTIMEGFFALYFLAGVLLGLYLNNFTFLIFHSLLVIGYSAICYYSIRHWAIK